MNDDRDEPIWDEPVVHQESGGLTRATPRGPLQLTAQGARNLMIALYGEHQVFMAEERFRTLSAGPPVQALTDEIQDWRAKFAMLQITVEDPPDEYVIAYTVYAASFADRVMGVEGAFPYGPDPEQWPPAVRLWFLAFTRGLVTYLVTPVAP